MNEILDGCKGCIHFHQSESFMPYCKHPSGNSDFLIEPERIPLWCPIDLILKKELGYKN